MPAISRLHYAFLASVLAHLLLLWLLRAPPSVPVPDNAIGRVRVRLQQPAPPPVEITPKPSVPTMPAAATSADDAPVTTTTAPQPTNWREEARRVARSLNEPERIVHAPLPYGHALPSMQEAERIPGLEAAFRPLDRRTKLCGHLLEFKFGVHDISMPVAYRCEDKQEEIDNAPGSGRHIDDAEDGR